MMQTAASARNRLDDHLKELHLPTVRACYEEAAEQAAREPLSHTEFLLALLERECEVRLQNRIERRLRESKLPLEKSLESFDLKRLPAKVVHQAKALLDGSFVDRRENVLAFGNPGSGKTHLLCAVCQELIRGGRRVLKRLSGHDVLLVDDLGYVQQTREEMEVLFTLLAERYERGSVMITSNLPFSKWESIFKDPMTTAAAIDRLVHHSIILELNLPSYRMEHAKQGQPGRNQNEATGREK